MDWWLSRYSVGTTGVRIGFRKSAFADVLVESDLILPVASFAWRGRYCIRDCRLTMTFRSVVLAALLAVMDNTKGLARPILQTKASLIALLTIYSSRL